MITEVFHVSDLKNNQQIVGQLQEKGLAVLIQHNMCKVYHSEMGVIITSVVTPNHIFKIITVILTSDTIKEIIIIKLYAIICN